MCGNFGFLIDVDFAAAGLAAHAESTRIESTAEELTTEGLIQFVPLHLSSDAICSKIFIRMCQSQIFFTHNTCRFTSGAFGTTIAQQQFYITYFLIKIRIDNQLSSGTPTHTGLRPSSWSS